MKKMNKSEYQDDQKLRAEYQKVLISKAMREIRDEEADSLLESSPEDPVSYTHLTLPTNSRV